MKAAGKSLFVAIALLAGSAIAGPVTTSPWNGYPGAVSFTFDDALKTQLDNAVPALRARNIHATFFLYDVGGTFTNNKAAWAAAAREGHELANHSITHADFSKSINATNEVSGMASLLRGADPSVQAVTFAYPYCAIGYESAVNAENIIGRGCMFNAPYQPLKWSSPPANWNNVGAIYIGDDATAGGATLTALDAAKNGGWITTLVHGVGGDWVAVSTNKVTAMFDRAIQNGLWVGTYQEVAAYWRAGLTMDTVKAISSTSGWQLTWKSPHPKMPKSVPLKVRLDAATFGSNVEVYQNGVNIPAQADGSYAIEFMKLALEVRKPVPIEQSPFKVLAIPGTIQMEDYDLGGEGVAYHDVDAANSGNVYRQDGVDLDTNGTGGFNLGWAVAGEWTEYTVDVSSADAYSFEARVATGTDSCGFHLEMDGTDKSGLVTVANTGGWSTYQSFNGTLQPSSRGRHVMRLVVERPYCNIDWIRFETGTTALRQGLTAANPMGHYKLFDIKGNQRETGMLLIGVDNNGKTHGKINVCTGSDCGLGPRGLDASR